MLLLIFSRFSFSRIIHFNTAIMVLHCLASCRYAQIFCVLTTNVVARPVLFPLKLQSVVNQFREVFRSVLVGVFVHTMQLI